MEPNLKNIEDKLNSTRAKKLLDEIEALKNKTEMNRAQGKEAKDAANAALTSAKDVDKVSLTTTSSYILCKYAVCWMYKHRYFLKVYSYLLERCCSCLYLAPSKLTVTCSIKSRLLLYIYRILKKWKSSLKN